MKRAREKCDDSDEPFYKHLRLTTCVSLPSEVIGEIFKYADYETIARSGRVNKQWRECSVMPELWSHFYQWGLLYFSVYGLPAIMHHPKFSQLKYFRVPRCLGECEITQFLSAVFCPDQDTPNQHSNSFSHLKSIDLQDCYAIRSAGLYSLRKLSHLSSLSLRGCKYIQDDLVNLIYFPQLVSLNLSTCIQVTDGVFPYLKPLVNLKKLNITFTGVSYSAAFTSCSTVTSLTASNLRLNYSSIHNLITNR
eukprot:TRINITY_DN8203_c3_g1_i1.p1 TRINITY_DN8203_c3_g1~~TRINITY_DN8203_c3_g1_i1.p1  ORF type:complete len:250 (+),score=2.62 TRINITY_DN8203_c3_g1_i1:148-897(+)